jgi:UDP-N-acetylmuramoyl-L-alanyl-D-glutamate--2,6-diaminopimelate ligase
MESYFAAKARLFTELLAPAAAAILNADSAEYHRLVALCRARGQRIITYGHGEGAHLRLVERTPRPDGQRVTLSLYGMIETIDLKLVGDFQVMNVLAALGLVVATGGDLSRAAATLPELGTVPGRMQLVGAWNGAAVFVDYAHTPDALTTALTAARPHTSGRLAVVFGAGGDRDPGKRPMMGQACAEAADILYVTDDNPRTEDAATIRRAVLAGAAQAIEIGDRREAIHAAIAALEPGDVLVIAGKGHETGQVVGREILPFDDVEVAAQAIRAARAPGAT